MAEKKESRQPLAEVFGHLPTDFSTMAKLYRKNKLCPFNNKVPSCTKDKARDPLGVCSVIHGKNPVITCPVRFRENWLIAADAADFFFGTDATWTSLTEVRLVDYYGNTAGNIDVVLVAYDNAGKVYDFGSLEIQSVYISGNVRDPFSFYMNDCRKNATMDWSDQPNYPRPDFLSSSRKRLAPQLMFKGGILHAWKKKMAVALDSHFFETLPNLDEADQSEADVAWLVYDLIPSSDKSKYELQKTRVVHTKFTKVLNTITKPKIGKIEKFMNLLQSKVDEKLESLPTNSTIESPFGGE